MEKFKGICTNTGGSVKILFKNMLLLRAKAGELEKYSQILLTESTHFY